MGMNNSEVKKANYRSVLTYMLRHDIKTKADISYDLGLSIPTVTQALKYLESRGIVTTVGTMDSAGGRKAVGYRCVNNASYAIGVEITANHVGIVVINLSMNTLYSRRISMRIYDNAASYDAFVQFLNDSIDECGIDRKKILGIGISLPAIIDGDGKTILSLNTELALSYDFYHILESRMTLPYVLYNDANCAATAEISARGTLENEIYYQVSQSVGGAIIRDGVIDEGDTFRAGEFGHMTLHSQPGARKCYCGKSGCVNAYISTKILADAADGNLQYFFNELPQNEAYQRLWNSYLNDLALSVDNLIMCFNRRIIIGGYLGQYIQPYMNTLRKLIMERDPLLKDRDIQVEDGRLKNNASAIGAAAFHIRKYLHTLLEE